MKTQVIFYFILLATCKAEEEEEEELSIGHSPRLRGDGINDFSSLEAGPTTTPVPLVAPPHFTYKTTDPFQKECLDATNKYRAKHHEGNLSIDPKLVEFSQSRCLLVAISTDFESEPNSDDYGENIFLSTAEELNNCTMIIEKWYKGFEKFKVDEHVDGTEQFTQLVWKSTTTVGCTLCGGVGIKYKNYLVCNYNPAGNFEAEFHDNILMP